MADLVITNRARKGLAAPTDGSRASTNGSAGQAPSKKVARTAKAALDEGQELAQQAADRAQRAGETATERGQQVASAAAGQAHELVGTVREEAARVTEEVSAQVHSLAGETKEQLEVQAQEAAHRLADGFRQMGSEARALAEGRPAEAPNLRGYVWQAADRFFVTADGLDGVARSIDERGMEGLVEDVQSFARRRPAAFLLGAAAAGFVIGRVIRGGSGPASAQVSGTPEPMPGELSSERELALGAVGGRRPITAGGR
ncbi:MAG: hypothetical protein M3083_06730 [Actinomycetota bacterium]|nr:hypothetical protein [Actinomycetota bacterium]